ncbi:MAG: serine kinase [Gemmobacter sp.]|jgi:HPr kinase/phosphorylase|nr:serine kinase [Gemmobacter sp.]
MQLHASCIALAGRGLLILGPSGAGKSVLALELMAFGCALVADDRVDLRRDGDRLVASAPPQLSGLIEARHVGLLQADALASVPLVLAVDLARREVERLPHIRQFDLLGCHLDLVLGAGNPHLSPALLQYLRGGRQA